MVRYLGNRGLPLGKHRGVKKEQSRKTNHKRRHWKDYPQDGATLEDAKGKGIELRNHLERERGQYELERLKQNTTLSCYVWRKRNILNAGGKRTMSFLICRG